MEIWSYLDIIWIDSQMAYWKGFDHFNLFCNSYGFILDFLFAAVLFHTHLLRLLPILHFLHTSDHWLLVSWWFLLFPYFVSLGYFRDNWFFFDSLQVQSWLFSIMLIDCDLALFWLSQIQAISLFKYLILRCLLFDYQDLSLKKQGTFTLGHPLSLTYLQVEIYLVYSMQIYDVLSSLNYINKTHTNPQNILF